MIGSCPMHAGVTRHSSNHFLQPVRRHKSLEAASVMRGLTGHRDFRFRRLELEVGVVVCSNIAGDRCRGRTPGSMVMPHVIDRLGPVAEDAVEELAAFVDVADPRVLGVDVMVVMTHAVARKVGLW